MFGLLLAGLGSALATATTATAATSAGSIAAAAAAGAAFGATAGRALASDKQGCPPVGALRGIPILRRAPARHFSEKGWTPGGKYGTLSGKERRE